MVLLHQILKLQREEYCSKFYKMYLILDYHGISLRKQIEHRKKKNEPFTLHQMLTLLISVSSALAYLEQQGTSHQSLMPETILLAENKHYKLTDAAFLTGSNNYQRFLLGSDQAWYFSPEQLASLRHRQSKPIYDIGRSEVFVLGLILLEVARMACIQ